MLYRSDSLIIVLDSLQRQCETYPIPESEAVMVRGTTQIDHKAEYDEANNGHDLDRRKPKLAFAESTGAQKVDDDDDDTDDSNPHGIVDSVIPVYDRY